MHEFLNSQPPTPGLAVQNEHFHGTRHLALKGQLFGFNFRKECVRFNPCELNGLYKKIKETNLLKVTRKRSHYFIAIRSTFFLFTFFYKQTL